jgi:hypothetical protein
MRFADYYRERFRTDFADMLAAHHRRTTMATEVIVQPRMLSTETAFVCGWPEERGCRVRHGAVRHGSR